ncbi:MAG: hypothetical protein ACOCRL_02170 [Bacillota bacterium]
MSECSKCGCSCSNHDSSQNKGHDEKYLVKDFFDIEKVKDNFYYQKLGSRIKELTGVEDVRISEEGSSSFIEVLYDDIIISDKEIKENISSQK